MKHDIIAQNHIQEICQWTQDIRFLAGKVNTVADNLSRPSQVPLGTAYQVEPIEAVVPEQEPDQAEMLEFRPTVAVTTRAAARRPTTDESHVQNVEESTPFDVVDISSLARAQSTCPDTASHRQGKHPTGLIFGDHKFASETLFSEISGDRARPLVPDEFRQQIMQIMHGLQHPGQQATIKAIATHYYWPRMKTQIANFVSKCHDCNVVKATKTIVPPMSHRPVQQQRFHDLMFDIIGPLPDSGGMRYSRRPH